METTTFSVFISVGLFFGMLILIGVGYYINKMLSTRFEHSVESVDILQGALFALLGLLIAFTFTGAYDRYDHRRLLIIEEVNAIEGAYQYLDLLPSESQPLLREKFRTYLNERIAIYEKIYSLSEIKNEFDKATQLQKEIWALSVQASSKEHDPSTRMLMLPALIRMNDITTIRQSAILTHVPGIVISALMCLSLTCAFLIGLGLEKSTVMKWIHAILFCAVTAFIIYIILDIEYPRFGLVNLNKTNEMLKDLRVDM